MGRLVSSCKELHYYRYAYFCRRISSGCGRICAASFRYQSIAGAYCRYKSEKLFPAAGKLSIMVGLHVNGLHAASSLKGAP
jgi:hypothetical protein